MAAGWETSYSVACGLALGAGIYLMKSVGRIELLARVPAELRQAAPKDGNHSVRQQLRSMTSAVFRLPTFRPSLSACAVVQKSPTLTTVQARLDRSSHRR